MIAAFIEKNTWAGLDEFFLNLAQALHIECEQKVHKETGGPLNQPGIQNDRITEHTGVKNVEVDVDRETNSDKDGSELSVSKIQKELDNSSRSLNASKGK